FFKQKTAYQVFTWLEFRRVLFRSARVSVVADGVPPGWGEPVYGKLDAELAAAMMSINAVKGVEIGDGLASVSQKGSEHRDAMAGSEERRVGKAVMSGASWGDAVDM